MTAALAHTLLAGTDAVPERWMLFLHGILGKGRNWRTIARRFVERCPAWGAVLVDLRMHGDSQGFTGPHTVAAAAADLPALDEAVDAPIAGVLGHSFGGKVALAYLGAGTDPLEQAWIVDSLPGARPSGAGSETTRRALELLDELEERPFPSREEFVSAVRAGGLSRRHARWLATNLVRDAEGYRFAPDVEAVAALLEDYFRQDLWHLVEEPPPGAQVHVVVGGRSPVFGPADVERVRRAVAGSGHVHLHPVADAGHWVHADQPDAMLRLLVEAQE